MTFVSETGRIIHRLIPAICWVALGAWLFPAVAQSADESEKKLQGSWIAAKAVRDGKAASDVVGHRLSFAANRFHIESKDGKALYAGTVRLNPKAKPATIDFDITDGALKEKGWKGIYTVDGDTLTTCDNAPDPAKGRPSAFEANSGSGYVLITFKRSKL